MPTYSLKALENLLQSIQKKINYDLVIGAGNTKHTLEKTAGWSGNAVEHARAIFKYSLHEVENKRTYRPEFFSLKGKPTLQSAVINFAIDGSNGLLARAGNCQEYTGLAIYHIIKKNQDKTLIIDVIELDECFDHVMLRIRTKAHTLYYDPWKGIVFTAENRNKTLLEIKKDIIEGFKFELQTTKNIEEKEEINEMMTQCEKIKGTDKVMLIGTLKKDTFNAYIETFDKNYAQGLSELYSGKPLIP